MNITKKVCIYILVGLITITGTFSSFYKGAYAFEYVGGALAFEEAIKWLLASVGIISAGGITADYWEQHGDEFEDYCIQQNITDTEVANWQLKLCEGVLDKGSACWQAFKEWASTLTGSSSGGGSGSGSVTLNTPDSVQNVCDAYCNLLSFPSVNLSSYSSYDIYCAYLFKNYNYNTHISDVSYYVILCYGSGSNIPVLNWNSSSNNIIRQVGGLGYIQVNIFNPNGSLVNPYVSSSDYSSVFAPADAMVNICWNVNIGDNISTTYSILQGSGSGSVESDFVSVQQDVTDLDIISSPIPDTDAQEVAIPMPGVSDSDNEASASAYDDIIDAVNNGQIELDDAITQIQDILKIIVYEEETEKIFPKPDNEEDQEDLDDKINQNKDNMAFTLGGLETVFPFCIPWDIYAFMSLLRADPVPPKVELPFPNPLDAENPWIVEVDFSDWDDGMRIVRLAEDFLFIIGLALLTRSLIGAGGGDG